MQTAAKVPTKPSADSGTASVAGHVAPNIRPPTWRELHPAVGNQALLRLLRSGVIQAKLTVILPDDVYEQEADQHFRRARLEPAMVQRAPEGDSAQAETQPVSDREQILEALRKGTVPCSWRGSRLSTRTYAFSSKRTTISRRTAARADPDEFLDRLHVPALRRGAAVLCH
jgi:hypothetical protein